jgi:glycosyltransferase involved in cell wall biosynthesis
VASNRSSIPEVLSGAGILIDPENVAAMADAIDAVVFDDATAQRLRQRGLDVARHLSWDRTALDTLRVYRDVLART